VEKENKKKLIQNILFYFLTVNFAPQAEHVPFSVILGSSGTSAPQIPHFGILSPQYYKYKANLNNFLC